MGWAEKYAKDLRKRAERGNGDDPKQQAQEEETAPEEVGADGLGVPPADGAKVLDGDQKAAIRFTLDLASTQQERCLRRSSSLSEILQGKKIVDPRWSMQSEMAKNQITIMQTLATLLDLQIFRITGTTNIKPAPGKGIVS